MNRTSALPLRLSAVALTALLLGGAASGGDILGLLFLAGLFGALTLLLSLPAGLVLHAWRPTWVGRVAEEYDRRGTAALLVGAGVLLGLLLVSGVLQSIGLGWLIAPLLLGAYALFLVGFAGCSRRQGMRVLEGDLGLDDGISPRPLVIGWLVRAGAAGTPLLWPLLSIYLLATGIGAPIVALCMFRGSVAVADVSDTETPPNDA